jgi:hypothetical protein
MKVARALPEEWLLVGLTLLVGALALVFRGSDPARGDRFDVQVTIVPSDATDLSCSSERNAVLAELPTPPRPFVTTDGRLIVMGGLFESTNVATWLEGARGTAARVKVRCPVTLLSPLERVSLRFRQADAFGIHPVPVLSARGCEVVR